MKLGRDNLKARRLKKDEIEEQLGSDKFNADISVADGELKMTKNGILWPTEKVDGS
jgi:hypothetical protein